MTKKLDDVTLPIKNQQLSFENLPIPDMPKFIKNSTPRDIFPNFKRGYSAFGMNNGSFSFGDVIELVLGHIGPAHGLISSWVASDAATEKVVEWVGDRRLLSARFLLDRRFKQTRNKAYAYIVKKFGVNAIRTTACHTKFCVLYNDDWFVVIETSANLNRNKRLESFRITENKEYCLFFKELFDNLFYVLSPKDNGKMANDNRLEEAPDIMPDMPKFEADLPEFA